MPHLADLIRILTAKSKGQMCLECTCGDKGPGAKLEDRAADCVSGACAACGFAKSWTHGLRPMLIEQIGDVDWAFIEGVPGAFLETMHWQNYGSRVKTTPGKKKSGAEPIDQRGSRALIYVLLIMLFIWIWIWIWIYIIYKYKYKDKDMLDAI